MEILFEQDNEEKSVASLILDALVKVHHQYLILEIICKMIVCSWEKKTSTGCLLSKIAITESHARNVCLRYNDL